MHQMKSGYFTNKLVHCSSFFSLRILSASTLAFDIELSLRMSIRDIQFNSKCDLNAHSTFSWLLVSNSIKRHSMNNCNKGPDNGKSVSNPSQTYMVDTPMGPDHKNRETRPCPQKWAELGGGQSWVFLRFGTPQVIQRKLFYYKRFLKNLKSMRYPI